MFKKVECLIPFKALPTAGYSHSREALQHSNPYLERF